MLKSRRVLTLFILILCVEFIVIQHSTPTHAQNKEAQKTVEVLPEEPPPKVMPYLYFGTGLLIQGYMGYRVIRHISSKELKLLKRPGTSLPRLKATGLWMVQLGTAGIVLFNSYKEYQQFNTVHTESKVAWQQYNEKVNENFAKMLKDNNKTKTLTSNKAIDSDYMQTLRKVWLNKSPTTH